MFLQCLWCRQLPSHMILYWAETYSCSSRICGDRLQSRFRRSRCSSVGFIINLSLADCWELHRGSNMPRCWNATSCVFSPSCPSKASGKYFSEAYCCHLPDPETGFMESLLLIPQSKRDGSCTRIAGTTLEGDCTKETSNSVLSQLVIAACSAALWVAGWCPINCRSPGLADNIFRNPLQQKRASKVQGPRLPHPREMQCRCYVVMMPLEIYFPVWRPCNDVSLRAF